MGIFGGRVDVYGDVARAPRVSEALGDSSTAVVRNVGAVATTTADSLQAAAKIAALNVQAGTKSSVEAVTGGLTRPQNFGASSSGIVRQPAMAEVLGDTADAAAHKVGAVVTSAAKGIQDGARNATKALDAGMVRPGNFGGKLNIYGDVEYMRPPPMSDLLKDTATAAASRVRRVASSAAGAVREGTSSTWNVASARYAAMDPRAVRNVDFRKGIWEGLRVGRSGSRIAGGLGLESYQLPVQGPLPEGVPEGALGHAGARLAYDPEATNFFSSHILPRLPLLIASGLQVAQLAASGAGVQEWMNAEKGYCDMIAANQAMTVDFQNIALQAQGYEGKFQSLTNQIEGLRLQAQAWQQEMALKNREFQVTASRTILINIVLCLMLAFMVFGKKSKAAAALSRGDAAVAQLLKTDPLLAQVAAATVGKAL